jgi:hypothetical protein
MTKRTYPTARSVLLELRCMAPTTGGICNRPAGFVCEMNLAAGLTMTMLLVTESLIFDPVRNPRPQTGAAYSKDQEYYLLESERSRLDALAGPVDDHGQQYLQTVTGRKVEIESLRLTPFMPDQLVVGCDPSEFGFKSRHRDLILRRAELEKSVGTARAIGKQTVPLERPDQH